MGYDVRIGRSARLSKGARKLFPKDLWDTMLVADSGPDPMDRSGSCVS